MASDEPGEEFVIRRLSVRAKLIALVVTTAVLSLVAVIVLSWTMRQQLIDQVDARLPEAASGFETELDDDLRDLDGMVRELASRDAIIRAIATKDEAAAKQALRLMQRAHPDLDVMLFDKTGHLVAKAGVDRPVGDAHQIPALSRTALSRFRGVVKDGCELSQAKTPPSYMVTRETKDKSGLVVGCMPLDGAFLRNARAKLGVELALVEPDRGARRPTGSFPRELITHAPLGGTVLREIADHHWALHRFEPAKLRGARGTYAVVLAMDVTNLRDLMNVNLAWAIGAICLATLLTLLYGVRIAQLMGRGLAQLTFAFKKLERHDYEHVVPVPTGDEIEALARQYNVMVDHLRERDKLRATLGKYMTQTVMDHLLKGRLELGGETLTVTILFSDIRSFTSISERMDAQALVTLLNEYFTAMVDILIEEDAVVDKYIGDAIMAVFGAPVPRADDALRSVRAAVRMREALAILNTQLAERGTPELRIGIGIHTGEVVAGNIGSEERMEYTVIGDSVNLASRLESATKDYNAGILISEQTHALVADAVVAEPRGEIHVKGREQPIRIFEVTALR